MFVSPQKLSPLTPVPAPSAPKHVARAEPTKKTEQEKHREFQAKLGGITSSLYGTKIPVLSPPTSDAGQSAKPTTSKTVTAAKVDTGLKRPTVTRPGSAKKVEKEASAVTDEQSSGKQTGSGGLMEFPGKKPKILKMYDIPTEVKKPRPYVDPSRILYLYPKL